jgi:putative transposase
LKKEKTWLKETNSQVLQFSLKCLQTAYNNFFAKRAKFPRFHARKNKQTFTVPQHVSFEDGKIYFPKFNEGIKVKLHRKIEGTIRHATVSKNCAGQFFVAILVEREIKPLRKLKKEVGVDLGITTLAMPSSGKPFQNIRPYRNLEQKLRVLNKDLYRKEKGSKNREKVRLKLARLHNKISNIRKDHLHKVSRQIIDENQVICLEDLNIKGMLRNRCLAKPISDVSLSELVRQIEYKGNWYGRTVIKIDRWFPSSKMCSSCNYVMETLPLDVREWTCPHCECKHNRDRNAAKNILNEGKRTVGITGLACGLDVRLESNQKQSRAKQEATTL